MAILRKQKCKTKIRKGKLRNPRRTRHLRRDVRQSRMIRRGTGMIVGKLRNFSKTPVIFLDIDGVLNSIQQIVADNRTQEWNPYKDVCCYMAMSNLMEVLERVPNTHIVISSTWRGSTSINCLRKIFVYWGMPKNYAQRIVAKTPHLNGKRRSKKKHWLRYRVCRGSEIKWFCKKYKVKNYVIIDDDGDMLSTQKKRFVQTDRYTGFNYRDMLKCVKVLTGKEVARRDI